MMASWEADVGVQRIESNSFNRQSPERKIRSMLDRVERRVRRVLWSVSERSRAERAGIRLGPENYCYAPRDAWSVIIDVGVGGIPTFAPWIRRETDAYLVLCDPTPKHLPGLRAWTSTLERAELIEAAVAAQDGEVDFFESDAQESGSVSSTHINRSGPGQVVRARAISLKTLFERASRHGQVGLIKLDLEGAEFCVLHRSQKLVEVLQSVPQWLIEFHPVPQTAHAISEISNIRRIFREIHYREFSRNGVDYCFWRA